MRFPQAIKFNWTQVHERTKVNKAIMHDNVRHFYVIRINLDI